MPITRSQTKKMNDVLLKLLTEDEDEFVCDKCGHGCYDCVSGGHGCGANLNLCEECADELAALHEMAINDIADIDLAKKKIAHYGKFDFHRPTHHTPKEKKTKRFIKKYTFAAEKARAAMEQAETELIALVGAEKAREVIAAYEDE